MKKLYALLMIVFLAAMCFSVVPMTLAGAEDSSADSLYNCWFTDFESDSIDTNLWRNNKDLATLEDDPTGLDNRVLCLQDGSQFDNYLKTSKSIPGDCILEFKFLLPVEDTSKRLGIGIISASENAWLLKAVPHSNGTSFDILAYNSDGEYYDTGCDGEYDKWQKIVFEIYPASSSYKLLINDSEVSRSFGLTNAFAEDCLPQVRFRGKSPYLSDSTMMYIDDIWLGQRLAVVPSSDGAYNLFFDKNGYTLSQTDHVKTVHKAKIVNNGVEDESLTLYLALLNEDTNKLEGVKMLPVTVAAKSSEAIELSFDNLGAVASQCKIKAIYLNNENYIKPYRDTFVPRQSLILEKNDNPADVVITYPNGLMKAFSLSIDDGFLTDRNMVAALNANSIFATFNIVGSRADGTSEAMAHASIPASEFEALYKGHELANHSYEHYSTVLTDEEFEADLLKAEKIIEDTGYTVSGYAYPNDVRGDDTTNYRQILIDNGYLYERATSPYGVPANPSFAAPVAADYMDFPITASVGPSTVEGLTALADKYFALNQKEISLYSLFTHSHDIGNADDKWSWEAWEEYCVYVGGRADIWYATNHDICYYIQCASKLEISQTEITNNSPITIWCKVNGELEAIEAGASLPI